jgi:hypothetical protein
MNYKIMNDLESNQIVCVNRTDSDTRVHSIPFAPDNTDYQQFKKDIQNGVVLNDADGNSITGTELTTFISTLP